MDVIPAIDLLDERVVRLKKGRYDAVTVYDSDPVELAARWKETVQRLHVVDLEGASVGRAVQRAVVERVVRSFGEGVQVGGGVRSFEAVVSYFELGVSKVVLGTAALADPELVRRAAHAYPDRVILAVDARAGRVATGGWLEQSETQAVELVQRFADCPLSAALYTDIDRDGTEVGPNVAETARLARLGGLSVIASGGVGTLEHLAALAGAEPGICGAIVGRALHEARFTLEQAVAAARVALRRGE